MKRRVEPILIATVLATDELLALLGGPTPEALDSRRSAANSRGVTSTERYTYAPQVAPARGDDADQPT